jgi:hypothetical protein
MVGSIDETEFGRIKEAYSEARLPRPNVQPMETSMQKTVLTTLGALLISGLAVQMATASEHHTKFRRAYNQWNGPVVVTPPARYNWPPDDCDLPSAGCESYLSN